ncbi:hypothetical protein GYMLUDRAFT_32385 [Collybiopsis luxurians FD-317 M1]|nr:hypothetical protein GYMLUDRAFT_32385 [Collybiopsis luxurians FD-317 M1]
MARFTRSSAAAAAENNSQSPPSSKKRKRPPSPEPDLNQLPIHSPSLADLPLNSLYSSKILDILHAADHHGLLDRVFPLSPNESLYSLRTLLKDSPNHSLSQLRSAVQHLFPISLKNSRSHPSDAATLQQAFCNLALSLLNQASVQSAEFPGHLESLIPERPPSPSHIHQNPRYALVQHLPSGDYWTGLSSDLSPSDLKSLPKGYSELVSILPSPYPSTPISDIPNLGSYHKAILLPSKHKTPTARKISSGYFLDYGPNTSFAPSFDQECAELGRQELGQLLFARKKFSLEKCQTAEKEPVNEEDEVEQVRPTIDVDTELEELIPPDQLEEIKSGLASLELELAVSELLERNKKALRRLQLLQKERLMTGASSSKPEEGSEEWDTAQAILDSLTTLASLRPRSSKHANAPLIPPAAVLRALHRTLPVSPSPGWYGNLPPGRPNILRDDNTLKAKPGLPASSSTPAAPTPTPIPAAPAVSNPGYTYSPYNLYTAPTPTPQQNQYRAGATTSSTATPYVYRPATTSNTTSYYPSNFSAPSQQQIYGSYAAGAWYNPYNPQGTTTNGSGSGSGSGGRGTPVNIQPTSFAPSYSSFFGNHNGTSTTFTTATATVAAAANGSTQNAGQRTPAVANTVMKPGYQWSAALAGSGTSAPSTPTSALTLPAHLRSTQNVNGTAGPLPGNMGQLGQQSSFYGYQQQGVTTQFNPTSITTTTTPTMPEK